MSNLAGRSYIPKLYKVSSSRGVVIDVLRRAVSASGGRVVSCSFPEERVAPVFMGAEDGDGHRYGLLIYPFTTTDRQTPNRPLDERRFQIRYGDPVRVRHEANPLGHDPAGVDVTLVLAVDPDHDLIVGLDPLVYAELPMGISGYYRDEQATSIAANGWHAWAKVNRPGFVRGS